jgi:glucosylceramidase
MQKDYRKSAVDPRFVLIAAIIFLVTARVSVSAAPTVKWRSTTQNAAWVDKGAVPAVNVTGTPALVVDTAKKFQLIDGFGGAFNELGWKPMLKLSQALRDSVMKEIFDSTGCNYSFCRMPIGASDFTYGYYSLNDNAGDYTMTKFSIARDTVYLIPFIKAAMKINPKLKLWGSPWSPPIWMKSNNAYNCTGTNSLVQDQKTLTAYALYFEKAVLAYQAAGIDFFALFFQNEPYACQNFPSCLWTGAQMRDFIKLYLGPLFTKDNIKCEIWSPTMNNGSYADAFQPLLDDTACSKYITGCGFQWAGEGAIPTVYQKHPEKKLWQTEAECRTGANSWSDADYIFGKMVSNYFQYGCGNYMQWNMILDKSTQSFWGWALNSMVTVDTIARTVTFTPEFYMTKHFTNAVKPGARRVNATSATLATGDYAAFQNPSGQIIVVIRNTGTSAKQVTIQFGSYMISPSLPANSFNTFYISDPTVSIDTRPASALQHPGDRNIDIEAIGGRIIITTHDNHPLLKIITPSGRTVLASRGGSAAGCRLSVAALPTGVYFAEVKTSAGYRVKRFTIGR